MEKDLSVIRCNLTTPIQSSGKTFPPAQLRVSNIEWIENLTRDGLSYGKRERQILMHTTGEGERLFIHYPGKESVNSTPKPWDFRPELYFPENSKRHENMSFGSIWSTIFETSNKLTAKNTKKVLRIFAILFYRMAFMLDHIEFKSFNTQERDVIYGKDNEPRFSEEKDVHLPSLFKLEPPKEVLEYMIDVCPRWGDMSLEAFLFYNDLLVWNEDCKYYYRNYRTRTTEKWIYKTGRVNTLLSHIRILGYMLGDVPLSDIFDGFARQRGMSPATNEEIIRICGNYITP